MSEPVTTTLGIKLSTTVAGFAGGVVSLAFVQGLTRMQAVASVTVGALTAAYLTPAALYRFDLGPELSNAMAFVIGLCAMSIIPAIRRGVAKVSNKEAGQDASTKPEQGDGGAQ